MGNFNLAHLFGNNSKPESRRLCRRTRTLRIEELEERTMLSAVTAVEFLDIQNLYPELNLGDFADYNIITIEADPLITNETALCDAIIEAGNTTQDDLIVFRTGDTAATNKITLGGTALSIDIDASQYGSVTIVSFGTANLTIDADNLSWAGTITSSSSVALAGLTITNSHGIRNTGGALMVTNCLFSGNDNGVIYSTGSTANVTVTNCTISGNIGGKGGGIYNSDGTLTVTNCLFSGNSATNYGGAIYSQGPTANVTLTNCIISGNSSGGGGIYTGGGEATVTNCTISGNSGGGIYTDGGEATVTNCTISGNTGSSGGGISNTGTLTVTNCTILGNRAYNGSGICNGKTLTVTNCTISGNYTTPFGSGGSGIHNWNGTVTIQNSIIAKNMTAQGMQNIYTADNNSTTTNVAYSLIDDTATPNGGKDFTDQGNNLLNVNPLFIAIPATISASNTGTYYNPTNWNLRLQAGSPAINKGNNSYASGIAADLDGYARIANGTVDMGAYEYQSVTPPIGIPVDKNLIINTKGTGYPAIKGVKNMMNQATVSSLTFTWDSTKNKTYKGDETVNILLYGAGGVKKGEKIASMSVDLADFVGGVWTGTTGGNLAIAVTEAYGQQYLIEINDLIAGTKYTAQIQVVGADGRLSKASTFAGKTTKYGAINVTKPSAKNGTLTANSVTLNWTYAKPPADNPTTHYAVYQMVGSGKSAAYILLDTVDKTETSLTITEIAGQPLAANTKYTFVVRAAVLDASNNMLNWSLDAKVSVKTAKA